MGLQLIFLAVLTVFAKGPLISTPFPIGDGGTKSVIEEDRRGRFS